MGSAKILGGRTRNVVKRLRQPKKEKMLPTQQSVRSLALVSSETDTSRYES